MAQAYEHLAEWFEYLNDDCDYAAWSQYFINGLARLNAGGADWSWAAEAARSAAR